MLTLLLKRIISDLLAFFVGAVIWVSLVITEIKSMRESYVFNPTLAWFQDMHCEEFCCGTWFWCRNCMQYAGLMMFYHYRFVVLFMRASHQTRREEVDVGWCLLERCTATS
mmetsp:Transcript_24856/g.40662  ORF Transcript_24856/g.40662 Transcript_24856/m.40662 type:complete len:111 (+) Transcript_24856:613-945(+)